MEGICSAGNVRDSAPRPARELSSLDLPGLFAVIVFFYEAKDFFDRFIENPRDILVAAGREPHDGAPAPVER